jgi:8-oxo-(d)GTP phosphatase
VPYYRKDQNTDPKLLLIQRGGIYQDWTFPKGKRENNKPIEDEALRETKEETGLNVKIITKLPSNKYSFYIDDKKTKINTEVHYFLAEAISQKFNIQKNIDKKESANFKQAKWVTIDEALNMVKHKSERKILVSIKEYFNDGRV